MKRGSSGLGNLTITLSFHDDGALDGLDSVSEGPRELGPNEAAEVFHALSESERERLTAECWEDAQLAGDEYETLDDAQADWVN